MLDLRPNLGLGFLDLADRFVQDTALSMLFVRAALRRDLPDGLAPAMRFTLLDPGITCISAYHALFAMQQLVDLADIRNIRRRDHHAVYQTRFVFGTYVRFGAEVILITLLGLVHFRVMLAVLALGQTGRLDQRRIDDGALA